MKYFWNAFRLLLWMAFITGIAYPLFILLIAQLTMPHKANGSMVMRNDKIIGSFLIGQQFKDPKYFWPRPSAMEYNPLPSGASNLSPASKALHHIVEERRRKFSDSTQTVKKIPSDLLFASGSGLDPHISTRAALFQIDRIIMSRNIKDENEKQSLEMLINKLAEKRFFNFFGTSYVNVLKLNLALIEGAYDK